MNDLTPSPGSLHKLTGISCAECESPIADAATKSALNNIETILCPACMEQFYVTCAECVTLLPRDESVQQDNVILCILCAGIGPAASSHAEPLENPEALINEYIALHAEEKRLKTRLDELKAALKEIAETQQRSSHAVTLRAGANAVKCSFRSSLKCNQEVVAALAERLPEQQFAKLFETKMSSPHQESVQDFLHQTDDEQTEVRELVRAAVIETEIATLTVVSGRKEPSS